MDREMLERDIQMTTKELQKILKQESTNFEIKKWPRRQLRPMSMQAETRSLNPTDLSRLITRLSKM